MIAAVCVLAACGATRTAGGGAGPTVTGPTTTGATTPAIDPTQPVTVALLAPLGSGKKRVAKLAKSLSDAAKLAHRDLANPKLKLKVYDSAGGAGPAAALAVGEGASLIIGPLFSGATKDAGAAVRRDGINVISFSTDAGAAGGNVYLAGFLPQGEVDRVVSYAARHGYGTLAGLYPETPYGRVTSAAAGEAARRYGVSYLNDMTYSRSFEGIDRGAKAYAGYHKSLGRGAPRAVLMPDSGKALQTLSAFLNYYRVTPKRVKFLGLGPWNSPGTLKEPGLRGAWFAAPDPRLHGEFVRRFEGAYGYRPPELAGLGYDAMAAAGAMYAGANADGPFSAASITDPEGFLGVSGAFRFLTDGRNQRALAVLEVKADGFKVADPAPRSFAAGS